MSQTRSQATWGFLTVLEFEEQGLIGGYLVLNETGRPLEFHCTAPVKPNRAQQILFGPTLQPYLYGEQIGQTLVSKGATQPTVVYTDVEPVLAMRDFVDMPVALVLAPTEPAEGAAQPKWRIDRGHSVTHLATFAVGANRLAVAQRHRSDETTILDGWQSLDALDLAEPFERIRDALAEAQLQSRG
jgi:hypothetical protein